MSLSYNAHDLAHQLSPRDFQFFLRTYKDGLEKYKANIKRLGLQTCRKVLDAGSGFGQWSFAFAELNYTHSVIGIDIAPDRINAANTLRDSHPGLQVQFEVASLEAIPYADNQFDCAFCFSSLYYADVQQAVSELVRVVRPGGKIYICSNAIGWYLFNLICSPNATPDFKPRLYALQTIGESILSKISGRRYLPRTSTVTSQSHLRHLLLSQGIPETHIQIGLEGTLSNMPSGSPPRPLLRQRYMFLDSCIECLATKP